VPGAGALTTLKHFCFARRRSALPQIVPTRERTGHGCSLGGVRPVLDLDVKGHAGGLVTWERAGQLGRAAGDHAEVEPLRLTGASLFVRAPSAGARSWTASPSLRTSNTRCVPRAGSSRDGRPGWGGQLILRRRWRTKSATSWAGRGTRAPRKPAPACNGFEPAHGQDDRWADRGRASTGAQGAGVGDGPVTVRSRVPRQWVETGLSPGMRTDRQV
jgi:hypothetical protein